MPLLSSFVTFTNSQRSIVVQLILRYSKAKADLFEEKLRFLSTYMTKLVDLNHVIVMILCRISRWLWWRRWRLRWKI